MEKSTGRQKEFMAYEYKEINVSGDMASFYMDCYENFGWQQDENFPARESGSSVTLRLKRDRRIANKVELTRLQRHFEADMDDIYALEASKTSFANAVSIAVGVIGTGFMAGSVFAVTASTPVIWLCVVLAVPAFAGWIMPYFIYKSTKAKKTKDVAPYIEAKYEEIYELCERGHALL